MRKLSTLVCLLAVVGILVLSGCGSFQKIKTEPYTGRPGYALDFSVRQFSPAGGTFTAEVEIVRVQYKGTIKTYKKRGVMLGITQVTYPKYADLDDERRRVSLRDFQRHIDTELHIVDRKNNDRKSAVQHDVELIGSNLLEIRYDPGEADLGPTRELHFKISHQARNEATYRGRNDADRTYTRTLNRTKEACVSCAVDYF